MASLRAAKVASLLVAYFRLTPSYPSFFPSSAVQMKYYNDPYVSIFVKGSLPATSHHLGSFDDVVSSSDIPSSSDKKHTSTGWNRGDESVTSRTSMHIMPPLINRGYHARVSTIRAAIKHFLTNLQGTQVLSLGAGFDTTYFVLKNEGFHFEKYIEIDVPNTVLKKASILRSKRRSFEQLLPNLNFKSSGEVTSDHYSLVSCDLRDLTKLNQVILNSGLDKERPTLILSECVLIYMTIEESAAVIEWGSREFPVSYFVLYEQIEPHDNFGKAMIANLKQRGCPLLSIMEYPKLSDQKNRFLSRNWEHVEAWTMTDIYDKIVVKEPEEKQRIDSLEFMDELEEWTLMNNHYCIVLASHNKWITETQPNISCRTDWALSFNDLHIISNQTK